MSVLTIAPDGSMGFDTTAGERAWVADSGRTCFYCGRQFHPDDGHVLHWSGSAGPNVPAIELDIPGLPAAVARALGMVCPAQSLFLHPPCFVELAARMFRDFHELECETDSRLRFEPRPPAPAPLRRSRLRRKDGEER